MPEFRFVKLWKTDTVDAEGFLNGKKDLHVSGLSGHYVRAANEAAALKQLEERLASLVTSDSVFYPDPRNPWKE